MGAWICKEHIVYLNDTPIYLKVEMKKSFVDILSDYFSNASRPYFVSTHV